MEKKYICNCCHSQLVDNTINWDNYKEIPRALIIRYGFYNKCKSCIKFITKERNIFLKERSIKQ